MARPFVVALDVDGVLADFHSAALPVLQECVNRCRGADAPTLRLEDWRTYSMEDAFGLTPEEMRLFDWQVKRGAVDPLRMQPLPLVERLPELAQYSVYYVTTPWPGAYHWSKRRCQWLQKYCGAEEHQYHPMTHKYLHRADVFVDDKLSNVREWERWNKPDDSEFGGFGVLWLNGRNGADAPVRWSPTRGYVDDVHERDDPASLIGDIHTAAHYRDEE